ncbi:hypothetical protein [Brevibacillus laterosporus]|uniref:Uncharacterized protein n=1 Tax=Brevibacillus laterosporus TaxID=1465 RepID=A0AAP8QGC7_BRELA|nr:hypothetical protein [Brevibacillus laterosporus]MBG9776155.1 hypothetical protein [Brevibacillus laterosporus]MED1665723.1 hypothetical protein [Brevibacillus laterosporus]MED1667188.1 hypothetical protein [Brevibacillus laterosporus]MED1719744.1 hypothetical protein [Brevibacillus laterosporus]PPB12874.1 hypothetical protein C4A77_00375 [Brevibacillus laterosporus]
MDNVIRFPITSEQRMKNLKGAGYVPCKVYNRWLQFERSAQMSDGEYIIINVMTLNSNGDDTKLCELVLTKEDLLRAINNAERLDV